MSRKFNSQNTFTSDKSPYLLHQRAWSADEHLQLNILVSPEVPGSSMLTKNIQTNKKKHIGYSYTLGKCEKKKKKKMNCVYEVTGTVNSSMLLTSGEYNRAAIECGCYCCYHQQQLSCTTCNTDAVLNKMIHSVTQTSESAKTLQYVQGM